MIQPFYNNVLTKVCEEEEEKTYGRIVLSETSKEKCTIAEVIAVGPGLFNIGSSDWITPTAKVGDKVLLPVMGGYKITYEGIEYIMMKDSDILGVLYEVTNPKTHFTSSKS